MYTGQVSSMGGDSGFSILSFFLFPLLATYQLSQIEPPYRSERLTFLHSEKLSFSTWRFGFLHSERISFLQSDSVSSTQSLGFLQSERFTFFHSERHSFIHSDSVSSTQIQFLQLRGLVSYNQRDLLYFT